MLSFASNPSPARDNVLPRSIVCPAVISAKRPFASSRSTLPPSAMRMSPLNMGSPARSTVSLPSSFCTVSLPETCCTVPSCCPITASIAILSKVLNIFINYVGLLILNFYLSLKAICLALSTGFIKYDIRLFLPVRISTFATIPVITGLLASILFRSVSI